MEFPTFKDALVYVAMFSLRIAHCDCDSIIVTDGSGKQSTILIRRTNGEKMEKAHSATATICKF